MTTPDQPIAQGWSQQGWVKPFLFDFMKVPILKLKNFEIAISGIAHKTHDLFNLSEELCQKMVDKHDSGPRHSTSSRYTYTTKIAKDAKGIPFGTAKAAVQNAVIQFFGSGSRNLIIKEKK